MVVIFDVTASTLPELENARDQPGAFLPAGSQIAKWRVYPSAFIVLTPSLR